jgi:hypothetical protein
MIALDQPVPFTYTKKSKFQIWFSRTLKYYNNKQSRYFRRSNKYKTDAYHAVFS